MSEFQLDPQLQQDCLVLGELNGNLLLLMNNALVPWFIIVPKTQQIEICELPETEQAVLYANINQLSKFILASFPVSKINMAAIGNVVSQLHIHVIGRSPQDYCWPNVVWGRTERVEYKAADVAEIIDNLQRQLPSIYTREMQSFQLNRCAINVVQNKK